MSGKSSNKVELEDYTKFYELYKWQNKMIDSHSARTKFHVYTRLLEKRVNNR